MLSLKQEATATGDYLHLLVIVVSSGHETTQTIQRLRSLILEEPFVCSLANLWVITKGVVINVLSYAQPGYATEMKQNDVDRGGKGNFGSRFCNGPVTECCIIVSDPLLYSSF